MDIDLPPFSKHLVIKCGERGVVVIMRHADFVSDQIGTGKE